MTVPLSGTTEGTPSRAPLASVTMDDNDLATRVKRLEDRAEILQLIASYGPSVDSGSAQQAGSLWDEAGTYVYSAPRGNLEDDPTRELAGRHEIESMVAGSRQQYLITRGSGHFAGPPHIRIDGDTAVAIGYSMLVLHDAEAGRNYIDRLSSNRWDLVRTPAGWRVHACASSLLDGRRQSRDLLRDAAGSTQL